MRKIMKTLIIKSITNILLLAVLSISNLVSAEHITVVKADNYPYKNLINRSDAVRVLYTKNNGVVNCKIEVALDNMKWSSKEQIINEENIVDDLFCECLPKESAQQLLTQTFVQFGRGL